MAGKAAAMGFVVLVYIDLCTSHAKLMIRAFLPRTYIVNANLRALFATGYQHKPAYSSGLGKSESGARSQLCAYIEWHSWTEVSLTRSRTKTDLKVMNREAIEMVVPYARHFEGVR